MEMPEAEISKRVRVLLAERRITASALARDLGLTQSYVARRMTGKVSWRASDLSLIAGHLGVDASALLAPHVAGVAAA